MLKPLCKSDIYIILIFSYEGIILLLKVSYFIPALMHSQNLETFTCISFMYIYAPLVHWICCLDLNMYIDSCSTIRIAMTMNTIIQGRSKHRQGTYGILYEDCSAWDIPFSSAISVCDNYQSFSTILSSAAIAQLVRHCTVGHGLISGKL